MKNNKYNYWNVIQQNYGQGWEDVSEYEATSAGQSIEYGDKPSPTGKREKLITHDVREYRLTGYATRVIFRKELKEQDALVILTTINTKKPKFAINDAVIVNTGGEDSRGYVCYPTKDIHGHYWQEQNSYCVHFSNGTKQYIPAKYIKKYSERTELNKVVFAYLMDCITPENYDVEATTDKEKLQFLADTFKSEYVYPDNLKRYGSYQNVFANWLMGLPSCFNIDFENYKILELAKHWGCLAADATEKQEDKILENWFNWIANKTHQLAKKNGVTLWGN